MRPPSAEPLLQMRDVLVECFAVSDAIHQLILRQLDPKAWLAKPPARNARTIAAIFTHVHNIRRKWIRLSAPHLKLPAKLDRSHCTQRQASAALAESSKLCCRMLTEAFAGPEGRVPKFQRDGWVPAWPAGDAMFAYMLTHEAHHRGQVCLLANQLGYPIPKKLGYQMWAWEKLWKQCGFTGPR
jgi:uncharacterized damage-inducible protein DinB